ncbi:MAG: glycosyltransferase family 4 protein [Candidatus Solibacter usitatus]|nr:glycosyltransferase family 4 protein [Candidatus Solibacter usitatus]
MRPGIGTAWLLHLDSGAEMRGGQWQALRLVQGLVQAGHQVRLLARKESPLMAEARRLGLEVGSLTGAAVWRLSRRADLVHAHDARSHTLAAVLSRAPLVVSRRVAFPLGRGPASRWKYARAARYLAVSRFVQQVLEQGGVAAHKIHVVRDAVPLLDPVTGGSEIVAPASEDPGKGTGLVKDAARLLGAPLRLAHNLVEELRDAAVFVYISHNEGLGSAILLAMSAGVPVVANRTGGIPEIVRDGETGVLTDTAPAAIAAAIRRLLEDRALACALAARARQMVEEEFSVARMVQETLRVYEQVLA